MEEHSQPNCRPASSKRIVIAIPAGSGAIHYTTVASLHWVYAEAIARGWDVHLSLRSTDSLVTRARNVLFSQFLKGDFTDLLFIDADVGFGSGVFTRLMSHEVDLVAGIYPVRGAPERYPVRPNEGWLAYAANGLMEVEAAPTGLMRITRRCAELMAVAHADEWYEDPTAPGLKIYNVFDTGLRGHEYWSEDYIFCKRFGAAGGKVWIDPDLPLSHSGDTRYDGHFGNFLRKQLAQQQADNAGSVPLSLAELARSFIKPAA